jgi:DNA-binding phage protein
MALETLPWDPVNYLTTPEALAAYIEAAFEDGDPALIAAALGDVARARGIPAPAMTPSGEAPLSALLDVTKALGIRIQFAA